MKLIRIYPLGIIFLFLGCQLDEKAKVDLAITNATLIDGTGNNVQFNVNLLIKDGRFLQIVGDTVTFDATTTIDATGKFVIPGLFDNHVHIGSEDGWPRLMSQFVHFGITSILIPGTNNKKFLQFKKTIDQDRLTTPTLYHTSLMTSMEGKHPAKTYGDHYTDGVNVHYVKDESSIAPIIAQAVKDKAIALKLMIEDGPQPPFVERIPDKYVKMLSEQAHEAGIDFFAHVSDMYEVKTAINHDADALMHFVGVQINWENDMEILQKAVNQNTSWVSTGMIGKSFFHSLNKQWLESEHYNVFDEDQIGYFKDEDGILEAESRAILKGLFGSDKIPVESIMKSMMQDFKKLHDIGINTVVGTDLGGRPFIVPGYSLHEEMELLEMGGFSPLEIIKCTTLNAAKMLHVEDAYGSIEPGKYADLVLLDKNPLEGIVNTLSINKVFKRGKEQPRINK